MKTSTTRFLAGIALVAAVMIVWGANSQFAGLDFETESEAPEPDSAVPNVEAEKEAVSAPLATEYAIYTEPASANRRAKTASATTKQGFAAVTDPEVTDTPAQGGSSPQAEPPPVPAPEPPLPPTGVTAEAVCAENFSAQVNLSWIASVSESVDGYDVFRSINGASFTKVAHVKGKSATKFTDTAIQPDPVNTSYTYKLRSTASNASSGDSNEVTVEIPLVCAQR